MGGWWGVYHSPTWSGMYIYSIYIYSIYMYMLHYGQRYDEYEVVNGLGGYPVLTTFPAFSSSLMEDLFEAL
jgi:hypothetical protein